MSEVAQKLKISYERKAATLHSFFALKFHDGDEDLAKVEAIEKALKKPVDWNFNAQSKNSFWSDYR